MKPGTVAYLIHKYIEESKQPGERPIGTSKLCCLQVLQRDPIGSAVAAGLRGQDYLELARRLRGNDLQAPTVMQYVVYLRVVLQQAADFWDYAIDMNEFRKARKEMERKGLIGKSKPRERRPTEDELERLVEYFRQQNEHPRTEVPMDVITEFSVLTARRISETCRLKRGDLDLEKRLCWVRDLKNPKGKGVHAQFPLLGRAWDIVQERLKLINEHPEARLFPYNSKTCSQRYTKAKAKLGIKDLRLHDNRREAVSRMFEQGYNVPEVAKLSLHMNPSVLLRTYTAIPPESLHQGPAAKRNT